jgi:hypothetical protein
LIALSPAEWRRATWRPWAPLVRPEPAPFDLKECLARLSRVTAANYGWSWQWEKAGIAPSLSRQEALFWYRAILRSALERTPKGIISALEGLLFTWELTLDHAEQEIRQLQRPPEAEIVIPLVNLFPAEQVIERLIEADVADRASGGRRQGYYTLNVYDSLAEGVCCHVVPYLTHDECDRLRGRLRPSLDPCHWPSARHELPPVAFALGASLGCHAEMRRLVESWADDDFSADSWGDLHQSPQEMIFGLGDPREVEHHMTRLKLPLRNESQVIAWLAHTEHRSLDWVYQSIRVCEGKDATETLIQMLGRVRAPETAAYMLELMLGSKAPKVARDWLEANPSHAAIGLLPVAAGRGKLAEAAVEHLRRLKKQGFAPLIESAASGLGSGAERIRTLVLDAVEETRLPFDDATTPEWLRTSLAAVPVTAKTEPPAWSRPEELPPVAIGDRCLSDAQAWALLAALRGGADRTHPLVAALREHAAPASLDAFAWRLFECWLQEGGPSKEKWAMLALGLFGGDTSALRLAPLVRAWPGESQHPRAVLGLEVLRAIGTDTALLQINGIAQKVPFKGLKAKALECMEAIAAERGLTRPELEDRIVPDGGLDDSGTRVFDFGPRRFHFLLGPGMKPMVRDESGAIKPDLPKPNTKDDAGQAAAAVDAWKLLKKQVADVAKVQAARLEQAMVTGRRWSVEEFETLLVRHPLMRHLVRMVVWGIRDPAGTPLGTFRVTEDETYADAKDEALILPQGARVGIIHPLHLSEAERAAWGELHSDYEIVPPFAQIGRPIHRLEPGEAGATRITRFDGRPIPATSLVGTLERLGWTRGIPEDAGIFHEHSKPFYGAGVSAIVQYEDGVPVGYMEGWDDQRLAGCFFISGIYRPELYPTHPAPLPLGEIDAVVISEVLSDLTVLASKERQGS